MNDWCEYRIQLAGRVDARDLNATGPLEMKVERLEAHTTWLSVHTDQSGLIGLMRHLHGLGFVLFRVERNE